MGSVGEKLVKKISSQLRDEECRPGLLECNKKLRSSKKTWLEKFDVKSSKKTTLLLFNNARLNHTHFLLIHTRSHKKNNRERQLESYREKNSRIRERSVRRNC